MSRPDSNSLCLECGLCCNGVIFADVQLRAEDDAARLRALGLALVQRSRAGMEKFKQPCTAFAGCKCNIYSERPTYCRQFECLLLKRVKAGEIGPRESRRVIRSALQLVGNVKSLLQKLGDTEESLALSKRVRRMRRKVESGHCDKETARIFGELTLVSHELNILLAQSFYPGA
jgi:uncharacterized protein